MKYYPAVTSEASAESVCELMKCEKNLVPC